MNKVILLGRLTRDPEVRYSQGENPVCIARYTLAVDRRYHKEGEQSADFVSCIAFGRAGEFAEKYLHQGSKILIGGRIQTGSYTNKEGQKVYTTDVVVEEHEFAESKSSGNNAGGNGGNQAYAGNTGNNTRNSRNQNPGQNTGGYNNQPAQGYDPRNDGFMNIPEGIDDELPFN